MTTETDTKEAMILLASCLKLRRPRLNWSNRVKRAHATPSQWKISMGPQSCGEWVLLHELAHLLCFRERGDLRRGSKTEWHGPAFVDALERIAELWYGSMDAYPWEREYRIIRKRRG